MNLTPLVILSVLVACSTGCGVSNGSTGTANVSTTVAIRGVVALTDSEGGIWATRGRVGIGETCEMIQDLLPGLNSGPRPFSVDAQVTVMDDASKILGATALDHPMAGTVVAGTQRDGSYYCQFSWHITVPTAALYSFEFPHVSPQRFSGHALPDSVILTIGNGEGFTPQLVG